MNLSSLPPLTAVTEDEDGAVAQWHLEAVGIRSLMPQEVSHHFVLIAATYGACHIHD